MCWTFTGLYRSRFSWVAPFALGCFRECDVYRGTRLRIQSTVQTVQLKMGERVAFLDVGIHTGSVSLHLFLQNHNVNKVCYQFVSFSTKDWGSNSKSSAICFELSGHYLHILLSLNSIDKQTRAKIPLDLLTADYISTCTGIMLLENVYVHCIIFSLILIFAQYCIQ